MKYLKNIGTSIGISILIGLIILLLITLLSYFNIIGDKIINISKIIIPIIIFLVSGILIGKKSTKKGWFEGLKVGIIILIVMILSNYLIYNSLHLPVSIYYIILLITASTGGMIGINKNNSLEEK